MAISRSMGVDRLEVKTELKELLPIRSRKRRISGWNRMTRTKIPSSITRLSRKLVAVRRKALESHRASSKITMPRRTRPELVLRSIHSSL